MNEILSNLISFDEFNHMEETYFLRDFVHRFNTYVIKKSPADFKFNGLRFHVPGTVTPRLFYQLAKMVQLAGWPSLKTEDISSEHYPNTFLVCLENDCEFYHKDKLGIKNIFMVASLLHRWNYETQEYEWIKFPSKEL